MSHQPGGQGLAHLVFVGEIVGDASDHVAEHDAHQRHHHHVLKLDPLDKPNENPSARDGADKREERASPQGGTGHEQHG